MGQLLSIQRNLTALVSGMETHHKVIGKRPGLTVLIGNLINLKPCLLFNFPRNRLFQCFTGLHKTSY